MWKNHRPKDERTVKISLLALIVVSGPCALAVGGQEPPLTTQPTAAKQSGPLTIYRMPADRVSWINQLRIDGKPVPVTAFPNIDAAACQQIAADYNKMPPWCHALPKFIGVHYALHLACDSELGVELTAAEPIRSFTIHPARPAVQASTEARPAVPPRSTPAAIFHRRG